MSFIAFDPVPPSGPPPSGPPRSQTGALAWLRRHLFNGPFNTVLTLISVAGLLWLVLPLFEWAVLHAVWNAGSSKECREIVIASHGSEATGACWAVFRERMNQLLFGFYPSEFYWRPVVAFALLIIALAPFVTDRLPRRLRWFIIVYPILGYSLIWGISDQTNDALVRELAASAGMDASTGAGLRAAHAEFWWTRFTHLESVESAKLGGLLLTAIVATTATALAIPVGVLLALGSSRAAILPIRVACMAIIQIFRGIPLIILIMASVILLFYTLPLLYAVDLVLRLSVTISLPAGAYVAGAIQDSFRGLPRGQFEAAAALGMTYWGALRAVILPQAISTTLPRVAIAGAGIVKDTSIIGLAGLLDPVGLMNPIRADVNWHGTLWELFVVVGLFYWVFSFALSRYAKLLDSKVTCHRPPVLGDGW